jgi:hypothetical protein
MSLNVIAFGEPNESLLPFSGRHRDPFRMGTAKYGAIRHSAWKLHPIVQFDRRDRYHAQRIVPEFAE